jgi:hypothetical protein
MAFDLAIFKDKTLDEGFVGWLTDEKVAQVQHHFGRLWDYYANEMAEVASTDRLDGKDYRLAQERGLPARIVGGSRLTAGDRSVQRKEIVIENDIAWRINAMVDFLFGKPIAIVSHAPQAARRREIEAILSALFEANGGITFFQDMAVLGSVYGFVDCLIRPGTEVYENAFWHSTAPSHARAMSLARSIALELVEAPRALPILDEGDYRQIRYYLQHFTKQKNSVTGGASFLSRLLGRNQNGSPDVSVVTEVHGPDAWQRYEDGELAAQGQSPWGFVPLVHIQNIAQPYYYEGQSDVEPLIPLQDELNTRLSDRAYRITLQAFKMYLAKGLESGDLKAVSPGRIWYTCNTDAHVDEFGGDSRSGGEDAHIAEIREALDKTSGVTPIVAGLLKSKIGNLTSAVALKMTLMGTLSRTERKKFTYGRGIAGISAMVLRMLDIAGIYHTSPDERNVEVIFPNPLPEDPTEKLTEAKLKLELGIPQEQVLRELGYQAGPDGVIAERIEV